MTALFKKCKLFDKTFAKATKQVQAKFKDFVEAKKNNPAEKFGGSDYPFIKAGNFSGFWHARNSDGVLFRFTPSMGKDETKKIILIKVTYYSGDYDDYIEVCDIIVDVSEFSDGQAKRYIEACLKEFVARIDDLSIDEYFNKNAATSILEEQKHLTRCVENQEDNTTLPQSSTTNEEES